MTEFDLEIHKQEKKKKSLIKAYRIILQETIKRINSQSDSSFAAKGIAERIKLALLQLMKKELL